VELYILIRFIITEPLQGMELSQFPALLWMLMYLSFPAVEVEVELPLGEVHLAAAAVPAVASIMQGNLLE
jgi:hypothetical protein